MFENTVSNYSNTCSSLAQVIQDLDVRIRVSEQNQKLQDSYTAKVKSLEENIALCNGVIEIMKPMLQDVMEYITLRKKESMSNINNALHMAGEIVKDSTEGIFFEMKDDEAWLSTPDGLEVDIVEGGGYRQISSNFVRSVVLGSNPNTLKTLMLDEVFSLVSPENSSVLSLYLNVICQDMQVISIEQKPQVYSNIDSVTYSFNNGDDYATVTKQNIVHDDINKEDSNAV